MRRLALNLRNKFRKAGTTATLITRNVFTRSHVTRPGGPVVSLTSYGHRTKTVFLTLESIARGNQLPSRLILWLDEEKQLARLPRTLRRLQTRGLEILPCENLGPHKKYYPYVREYADSDVALVTADDDVLYTHDWLQTLTAEANATPGYVICYRARSIPLVVAGDKRVLDPYSNWPLCRSAEASPSVFPTGTSGVLYPPEVQRVIRDAGNGADTEFRFVDDVWLHSRTIAAGYCARQVSDRAVHFPMIFLSQRTALFRQNVYSNENNERVKSAYTPELLKRIADGVHIGRRPGA